MAFNKTDRDGAPMRRRGGMHRRKKVCVFCGKDNTIDYKDVNKLKRYISERGKILPRRITGNCAKHVISQLCLTFRINSEPAGTQRIQKDDSKESSFFYA